MAWDFALACFGLGIMGFAHWDLGEKKNSTVG